MATKRTDWQDAPDLVEDEWEDLTDWYDRGYEPGLGQDQYALISGDGVMVDWVWADCIDKAWDTLYERDAIRDDDPAAWVTNLSALLS